MTRKSNHRALADRVEPTFTPRNATATTVLSSDRRVLEIFGELPSSAGFAVTEISAMRVSAVYACVRIIAGAIASMPLDLYTRRGNALGEKRNETDDLWWLLNEEPHPRWTASSMWKWLIKSELLRGDGFAEIQRDRMGNPIGLRPLRPGGVDVVCKAGRLQYFFTDDDGKARGLDQDDMIHIPGFGFDGLRGMSAIQWGARNGIGIALATDEYSGKFFANGALQTHALTHPGNPNQQTVDNLRDQFAEKYGQGVHTAFRPMILTGGVSVKELSLSAEDSQLLEARKFQVIDIARAFGVPPFMVGESEKTTSFGAGVEHMSLGFVKYTLQDRLITIEQELNRKLFRTASRYVKFNVDELLRGDSAARAVFLRNLVGGSQGPGIITANEARQIEGWQPLEDPNANLLYDPRKGGLFPPAKGETSV